LAIKVGADPEFFLKDSQKGLYISAHGYVPGTKENPHPLTKGAVQLDGTAVEFNINPTSNRDEFATNIKTTIDEIRQMIPRELSFAFQPTVVYHKGYFDKDIPEGAKELGCTPDFAAERGGDIKPPPENATTMRTGSGHIHIGWGNDIEFEYGRHDSHFNRCIKTTLLFDGYLKLYKEWWDRDRRRFKMYGAGGAFRPKPYGVECRSPSNAWLRHPELWPWLHDVATFVGSEWNNESLRQLILTKGATKSFKRRVLDSQILFPMYEAA
jgi:hypothetical protein